MHALSSQQVKINERKRIIFALLCLALSIPVVLISIDLLVNGTPYEKRFQPFLEQFASLENSPESGEAPYIKGKVMAITCPHSTVVDWSGTTNVWRYEVDSILNKLPKQWKPKRPDEIETVVFLKWIPQSVGRYIQGEGYVQTCIVTVIDKTIPAVLDRREFRGGPPPERGNADHYGSSPAPQIVNYLTNLPQR